MSEEQRAEVEKARQEAELSAAKFEKVLEATEPRVPQAPKGRPPETVPHRAVPVESLERKPEPKQKPGKKGRTLRDAIRERYRPSSRRMPRHVRESRGAPVYHKGRVLESSGRISTELNPQKAQRLAVLRERVRAVQNRRELNTLEKLYRRFRAQYTHDPELRP
jgi:hypothetical protein